MGCERARRTSASAFEQSSILDAYGGLSPLEKEKRTPTDSVRVMCRKAWVGLSARVGVLAHGEKGFHVINGWYLFIDHLPGRNHPLLPLFDRAAKTPVPQHLRCGVGRDIPRLIGKYPAFFTAGALYCLLYSLVQVVVL